MKVILYQMDIAWEDKALNYLRVEEKLKAAADQRADLFLLPEMSFTGFSMNTGVTGESDFRTVQKMRTYAKQYNTALGFGWVKDCGEKAENHYTVVDNRGEVLSDYIKIHPFSFSGEDRKFQGGEKITFFSLNGISFSSFICYDLRFPEIFQIASKKADVLLVPANWPKARREHWKCLLRARAVENQVYIIAVNCAGEIGGVEYSGDSCIIDPDGQVLSELSGQEGLLEYNLCNDVHKFRCNFPVKQDRREDLYYKMNNLTADMQHCDKELH